MVHPIGQAAAAIQSLNTEGIEKSTKIRSVNRQSASRFILGIPLMFSRKLTVWNPESNKHIYTSLGKSDWKKVKSLAKCNEADLGRLSKKSLATRKKLALEIIRKSGDTKGLTVLDRASPQQLCIIAKALTRYGKDPQYREQVLTALRAAQDQWQAMSMDPDTLDMVNEFMAADSKQAEKILESHYALEHQLTIELAAPSKAILSKEKFPDEFRKFVADLVSEDERDRNQTSSQSPDDNLNREERIKKVFEKHVGVVSALASHKNTAERNIPELAKSCGMSFGFIKSILDITEKIGSGHGARFGDLVTSDEAEKSLKRLPATFFGELTKAIDHEVENYDLQKLGDYLKENIPEKNGNYGKFLSKVFEEYFSNLSTVDRRAVVSSYLRESGVKDSKEAQMVGALKGSGPYLLKILQLLGDTVPSTTENGKKLKDALGQLKDSLLPIAPEIQTAMVLDLIKQGQPVIKDLTNIRSLGAASVGETLVATAELEGGTSKNVVIKLLKPGVDQRAARERAMMERIAKEIPGMQETFAGIADQIDRELDLSREAENVSRSGVYRKAGFAYITPVKTVNKLDATQGFMFMEMASGSTVKAEMSALRGGGGEGNDGGNLERQVMLKDHLRDGLVLSGRLTDLSSVWLKEALFGTGFYHGDLHSGNMMYDPEQQGGLLTLIDFGNAGVLERHERANMLKLILSAENRYPDRFIETLGKMVGPESQKALAVPANKEALTAQVREMFGDPALSGSKRMLEAINLANNFDIAVPNAISNFARSQNMLDLSIKEINGINRANWQALKDTGVQNVEEPISASLSETLKATVKRQKKQIIALTGKDGWRMRKANPDVPIRGQAAAQASGVPVDGRVSLAPSLEPIQIAMPQQNQPQFVSNSRVEAPGQVNASPDNLFDKSNRPSVAPLVRNSEMGVDLKNRESEPNRGSSVRVGSPVSAANFLYEKQLVDMYDRAEDEDAEFMEKFLEFNEQMVFV